MHATWVFCAAITAGLVLFTGCARGKTAADQTYSASGSKSVSDNKSASDAKLIVTPEEGLHGKVAWVNPSLRFVVITFPVGQMASLDQRLNVYRRGLKVGEVKITGPQRDDSTVGDIVAGDAVAGDVIRDR